MSHTKFEHTRLPITGELSPNVIAPFEEFALSYNPDTAYYRVETTSIVIKNHVFLTLNGDHRESLAEEAEMNGIQGCIEYFIKNIALASPISEHKVLIGDMDDMFNIRETAVSVIGEEAIGRIKEAQRSAFKYN